MLALNWKESGFLFWNIKHFSFFLSAALTERGEELQETNTTKTININEEWSRLKQHAYSFNQPLIALNRMSDDSNPVFGATGNWMLLFPVLLYVTTAQAISVIRISSRLSAVSSVSPCFCLRRWLCGVLSRRAPTVLPNRAQLHSLEEAGVTSLLNDLGERAFSQFFQHDTSTWNDQIGSTQLREYWLYFFFFVLTLKPVTVPQRGNNKLWKTTYRASSSCGNKVPWTPTICLTTICVEFLKRDEGCNFVYRESIHN